AKTTRSIRPISFPIWFVVFLQCPGNPLKEHCTHPTDNVFNVDVSTQMLVLCYDLSTLVEWYALRDNRTRTFNLATWSPERGLILKTQKSIYARRSDMFGEVVRVASVKNAWLLSLEDGQFGGYLGLILIELSKTMNFTIEILDPLKTFGSWSEQQNIWTGVIGQLVANEADIGVAAFTMTISRRNVVDFTMSLIRPHYLLYFKKPTVSDVQWNSYFKSFSFDIWIALLLTIITASILLTIMKTKNGYFSMDLMSENYINVWGIYCQQGLP
ncbi:PREDICTED: glutamate receptor ionotropic, kainate 2-like, partial [Wasmannia auropunctata]|uniref:glutamate receptor ionotropic, kainate 2-like n=1 Tax=Wasmannia auropunctata TaxID=64793 RepID=UPI0005F01662